MNKIITAGLIFIIILMGYSTCNLKKQLNNIDTVLVNQSHQLEQFTDSNGNLTTLQEAIQVDKESLMASLAGLTTELDEIKGRISNVTTLKETKIIEKKVPTYIKAPADIVTDTLYLSGETIPSKAIFTGSFKDDWVELYSESNRDSTFFKVRIFDDFSVIQSYNRRLFKPNRYETLVKSHNKYSSSQKVQSYVRAQKFKDRFSVGIQAGVYATPKGIQPGIGAGLSFNIW